MGRRFTHILVCTLGLLAGVALIAWIGSYAEGFFWVTISRGTGIEFISVQRGTLAFAAEGPPVNLATGRYFWWLEPDEMFDKCGERTPFGTIYHLPDNGSFQLAIDSSQYPWRWQSVGNVIEGFMPLWLLALALGIIPGLWAFGLFDRKPPSQPPVLAEKSVLPPDTQRH
jgi:hypothetical protein